jgi:hypothetical protein
MVADNSIKPQMGSAWIKVSKRFPPDSAWSGFEADPHGASREKSAISVHICTASMFHDPEA